MKSYVNCKIYPYIVPYKDNRKKVIEYTSRHKEMIIYSTIMKYLWTALIISTILLLSMRIVDLYFYYVQDNIDVTEYELDQEVPTSSDNVAKMDELLMVIEYGEGSNEQSFIDDQPGNVMVVHELVADEINETEDITDANIETLSSDAYIYTDEQMEFIERVVEAEVTGTTYRYAGKDVDEEEMLLAKIRVCQVFLNRVYDTERFSHITNLYESVTYPGASSTVGSGRYLKVTVTDLTKEAVQIALDPDTDDLTDGALFFLANGATYNKYGDYLFTDAVGHSFFK